MTRAEDVDAAIERAIGQGRERRNSLDADRILLAEEVVRLRAKRRVSVFEEGTATIEVCGYTAAATERLLDKARVLVQRPRTGQ